MLLVGARHHVFCFTRAVDVAPRPVLGANFPAQMGPTIGGRSAKVLRPWANLIERDLHDGELRVEERVDHVASADAHSRVTIDGTDAVLGEQAPAAIGVHAAAEPEGLVDRVEDPALHIITAQRTCPTRQWRESNEKDARASTP